MASKIYKEMLKKREKIKQKNQCEKNYEKRKNSHSFLQDE